MVGEEDSEKVLNITRRILERQAAPVEPSGAHVCVGDSATFMLTSDVLSQGKCRDDIAGN